MAATVPRSSSLVSQMHSLSKNVLYSCESLKHFIPVCMLSSSMQEARARQKDELYRQVTIEVKGHDQAILNSYEKFTSMAAKELDVNIVRIYEPPKVITRLSLMKSVFVHKKHFHQYEMRTLYKVFEIKNMTGSTASTFLEYVQRNLPEGLAMKVTKHRIEMFPEHIKPPTSAGKSTKSDSFTTKGLEEQTTGLTANENLIEKSSGLVSSINVKQETSTGKQKKEEISTGKQKKEETSTGKQKKEETSTSKQKKEETSTGKQKKEESSSGKQKKEETSTGKQKKEETSTGKQKKEETSTGKQKKEETSTGKQKT